MDPASQRERFRALHRKGTPLLLPNPWDVGSARILATLGFDALATTSGGFAASMGRPDYGVTADEALDHAGVIVAATDLPVTADLEDGFGSGPAEVASVIERAGAAGLAGCSVEDSSGDGASPIRPFGAAVERVAAAAEAAQRAPGGLVLTARAENHLHGRTDLDDTIARLVAFAGAGADVVYAPGLTSLSDIAAVVDAVGVPVNVLAFAGGPSVEELAGAGVARISVGGAFAFAAYGALIEAAEAFRTGVTAPYATVAAARRIAPSAFRRP